MRISQHAPLGALAMLGMAITMLPSHGFAANASAAQSTTKACSTQYQAAKTAGTLNGMKWPQFLSNCSAAMNTSGASATAAPMAATPASPKAPKKLTTAAAAGGSRTTQQICSSQYQAAKTAGTLGGQKWPDFLSACRASIKGDNEDAATVPPEPDTTTASTTRTTSVTTKSAASSASTSGKALSAGQMAFRARIHECSTEWQGEKSAGTLPAGSKWPQFWSACNTRLKAQG